jgi:hypothetical protein
MFAAFLFCVLQCVLYPGLFEFRLVIVCTHVFCRLTKIAVTLNGLIRKCAPLVRRWYIVCTKGMNIWKLKLNDVKHWLKLKLGR